MSWIKICDFGFIHASEAGSGTSSPQPVVEWTSSQWFLLREDEAEVDWEGI